MKKRQWRKLRDAEFDNHDCLTSQIGALSDAAREYHNADEAYHAMLSNRIEDLRQQLRAIEKWFPPDPSGPCREREE